MRLHRLDLAAVGPFAVEQHVDFDALSGAGLFLLDGPTGAGKSTVLDAITFALYGAGRHNGDGRLHSDFAERGARPFVGLEFSVAGTRYRITRTPEFARPKKRGTGSTVEHATAHLERLEGGRWVSRSSNKAEIADLLDDVIGLTREQFNQVVLLPQGEFAAFLRAGDDERRDVLSRLFGTQLYQQVTDELDARRQVAARRLEAAAARVRGCVAAAAEAAGLDGPRRDELCNLDGPERDTHLGSLRTELAADARRAAAELRVARRAEQRARAAELESATAADRLRRYALVRRQADAHRRAEDATARRRDELSAAQRAEPVRALLAAVADAEGELRSAVAAAARCGDGPASSVAAARAADERIAQAAALNHLVEREDRLDELTERVGVTELAREAAVLGEQTWARDLAALPERLAAAERADAARAERAPLAMRLAAAERAAQLEPALAVARDDAQQAVTAHQGAVDAHQARVAARLAGIAAELAGQLHGGTPCPVCGSATHPQPAAADGPVVTAAQVQAAERVRTAAEDRRRAAEATVAEVERELAAARAAADGAGVPQLADALAALDEIILGAADVTVAALQAEGSDLRARHSAAVAALADARTAHEAALAELDRAREQLRDAAGTAASVRARRDELRIEAQRLGARADALRAVDEAERARDEALARAETEAGAAGFASAADGAAAVRSAADRARLAAQVDEWSRTELAVRAALQADEFAELQPLGDEELPTAVAVAELAAREAAEAAAVAVAASAAAADATARTEHAVQRFGDRAAELADALAAHDALAAEVAPVIHLARLARGMAGNRRVALTTYVLRHWFGRVVEAANARLRAISSGRYELIRVDEGESRTERAGLTLTVLDAHTGETRSPRSLSGGETFYTSLALALGLADVVRAEAGGVDLDTLFVDEGFGSLDAETLNQVMDVIDELRDGGRVVGVVSHVAELKERIPERLEVRRLADGSSALSVVA